MTPTALTPAGRGTRSKSRQSRPSRPPGVSRTPAARTDGARTAITGARQAAQGARTAAQGARSTVQGARTAAEGARTTVRGTRAALDGARTMAAGARQAATAGSRPSASLPAGGRAGGHRTTVKRSTVPHRPRRVSGPAAPARTARPRVRATPAPRRPLGARCVAHLRALPDHAVLDRIIRGRYWIPLLGLLLVGIVAMQVEVLKLNAGIGRSLERTTSLQTRNEQLRQTVAQEADDQRIESRAAHMGMVMPPPAAIRFLSHDPVADVSKAIAGIHVPDPTGFQAAQATTAAAASPTTTSGTTSAVIPTAADPTATTAG